ncbi:MAG: carbamate kinase [Pseudonocardiales bacterium]
MRVVVALGGNALSPARSIGSAEEIRAALVRTSAVLAELVAREVSLLITHGNGPQVGRILLQQEAAAPAVPPMPMDVCGAESQGQIGYLLAQALDGELRARGLPQRALCLITQVVVDGRDPAFRRPTKPVGPYYDEPAAHRIAAESGHVFLPVEGDRWRRVVASPLPLGLVEAAVLPSLVETGQVLVVGGGGGVPVVEDGHAIRGVEAVVDKDRTAALLAQMVGADLLLILTEVPRVQVGFGTPSARSLSFLTVAEALRLLAAGEFPTGSMGPKVQACCDFVLSGGSRAVIGALDEAVDVVFGTAGTSITPDG